MLDDALVAAELARSDEAAARCGSRLERESARVLREKLRVAEADAARVQAEWRAVRSAALRGSGRRADACAELPLPPSRS